MPGASKYEPDTASVDAKLPGDPLDRFLWLALERRGPVQRRSSPSTPASYMTDYLSDEAGAAIKANRNRPFFIYLAYNAPHTPFQATKADYAALGAIKDPRLRVYGAMIRALDRGVGKVMAALKAEGVDQNTIVIFTNDNGGAWYAGLGDINKPYRGWKGTFFEGGIRTPFFVRWPARIASGQRLSMPIQFIDVFPTLAAAAGAPLPERPHYRWHEPPTLRHRAGARRASAPYSGDRAPTRPSATATGSSRSRATRPASGCSTWPPIRPSGSTSRQSGPTSSRAFARDSTRTTARWPSPSGQPCSKSRSASMSQPTPRGSPARNMSTGRTRLHRPTAAFVPDCVAKPHASE